MAKFDCDGCGKCCRSFGEFIRIERQLSERDYYSRYSLTNEIFPVRVRPEFAGEIDEEFTEYGPAGNPPHKGCTFLRKDPQGPGFTCAVYDTRPAICREFRCYWMGIYDHPGGELKGRVIGSGELRTPDKNLAKIWEDEIAHLPHQNLSCNRETGRAQTGLHTPVHGSHPHGPGPGDNDEWVRKVIAILTSHGYHGELVD